MYISFACVRERNHHLLAFSLGKDEVSIVKEMSLESMRLILYFHIEEYVSGIHRRLPLKRGIMQSSTSDC